MLEDTTDRERSLCNKFHLLGREIIISMIRQYHVDQRHAVRSRFAACSAVLYGCCNHLEDPITDFVGRR